jgi:hypothetical protein
MDAAHFDTSSKEPVRRKRSKSSTDGLPAKRLKPITHYSGIESWRRTIQEYTNKEQSIGYHRYLRSEKIAPLTEQNLHEIPLMNLYYTSIPTMSQTFSKSQGEGASSLGPTDSDYESRLKDRRIYCMRKMEKPHNFEEVKAALAATRESPEPDNQTAENFPRRVRKSGNEGGAMQGLLPKVLPIIDRFWDSDEDADPVDQQWDRRTLLDPDLRPSIKPAKPDQAFGFMPDVFPFPQASLHIKSAMCPARDLAWPYFTVETKGRQGQLDVARLQNSLNGAIIMNNMLQLKRVLGKEEEFLARITVMTMELTSESISLSGHFTLQNPSGDFEYHSTCLFCASAVDPSGFSFKNSYKQAMNAVERFRNQTRSWIMIDMAALDEKLVKLMQRGLNQMTPPTTHPRRSH